MKKILLFFILVFSIIGLSACMQQDGKMTVEVYKCEDSELKVGCNVTEEEYVKIFKADEHLCKLAEGEIDVENFELGKIVKDEYSDALILNNSYINEGKIGNLEVQIEETKNATVSNKPKNIDILFDLTYYSVNNKEVEAEIVNNRKQKLFGYLKGQSGDIKLENGDNVILRFIGTIDYGQYPQHKNEVFKDKKQFVLKENSNEEIIGKNYKITVRCKEFKTTKKLKIYTYTDLVETDIDTSTSNSSNTNKTKSYFNTKTQLIEAIEKEIDSKYNGGKYSYGTFLLESLYNQLDFLNLKSKTDKDVSFIFSDFRFQLHPEMKKNKEIPDTAQSWNFPPDDLDLWENKDGLYYKFYNETVPQYMQDKCPNGETVYLIGFETDNLDKKILMQNYFKDVLLKKCNVYFN